MIDTQILKLAEEVGFHAALIPTTEIIVDSKFRPYCEENLCGNFGANYSCPPDCGTVEEVRHRLMARDRALVLQSV